MSDYTPFCHYYEATGAHLFQKHRRERPGLLGRLFGLHHTLVFCYACGQEPGTKR